MKFTIPAKGSNRCESDFLNIFHSLSWNWVVVGLLGHVHLGTSSTVAPQLFRFPEISRDFCMFLHISEGLCVPHV